MQLVDERVISRGMVKVDSGEDLVESLQALAEAAGWIDAMVSGAGMLELVELLTAEGKSETFENAELISLAGRVQRSPDGQRRVVLRAAVAAAGAVHSGRITAAMTGGLLLVVDAVSELAETRSVPPRRVSTKTDRSPSSVAPAARAHSPVAASPVAASPVAASRTTAAPAGPGGMLGGQRSGSKPLSQSFKTKPVVRPIATHKFNLDDEDDENPILNVGDFVDHPQLGLCEVIGDDDSGGTKIRVPSGKSRVLRLEHLIVLKGVADDDGRMVFKVTGPRKRR